MTDTAKDDGGAAFPKSNGNRPSGDFEWGNDGMSLRDWFAGKALMGMMADSDKGSISQGNIERQCGKGATFWQYVAAQAYQFADAMLEARKK